MIQYAFKMQIPLEHAAEYKKRHDEIWPELVRAHEEAGIRDYTIFLDEDTGVLFATMKLIDHHQLDALGGKAIVQKWWAMNKDIQRYDGEKPYLQELKEVFHMD